MTSDSEHTNRPRPQQQAQGRKWPIIVLLLGVVTLALALTACGGSSSTSTPGATSAPDGTNATGATDWDTTINFSLENGDEHLENFHMEKCGQVTFLVTVSGPVQVEYQDPSGKDPSGTPRQTYWDVEERIADGKTYEQGGTGELRETITPLGSGYGYLAVAYHYDHPAKAKGTLSYRVDPPTNGTTC